MKTITALRGPNGSGKSTIYDSLVACGQLDDVPWVNADDLLVQMGRSASLPLSEFGIGGTTAAACNRLVETHALTQRRREAGETTTLLAEDEPVRFVWPDRPTDYEAAILADVLRTLLMGEGLSFTFETVMSHPSKPELLERARDLGYRTLLIFVCTEHVELNVARVGHRARMGAHDVPVDKVRARYERSLALLPRAIAASDAVSLVDTSEDAGFRVVATQSAGVWSLADTMPTWARDVLPTAN